MNLLWPKEGPLCIPHLHRHPPHSIHTHSHTSLGAWTARLCLVASIYTSYELFTILLRHGPPRSLFLFLRLMPQAAPQPPQVAHAIHPPLRCLHLFLDSDLALQACATARAQGRPEARNTSLGAWSHSRDLIA